MITLPADITNNPRLSRWVRVAADGNLYLVTDEEDGKLLKLEPPQA